MITKWLPRLSSLRDKATSNPRDTIRDQVWPEFSALERGEKDNLLTAEVVALLQTRPALDPERGIQNVIWRAGRHYRLSVTVDATNRGEQRRQRLFQGYDTVAVGPLSRRRGEVFEIPDLRPWMGGTRSASDSVPRKDGHGKCLTPTLLP